jgi:hypothetical protein
MRLRPTTNWDDLSTGDAFAELRPRSFRVGLDRALALISSEPDISR